MSAGGIFGLFFNLTAFAAIWTIFGMLVDKVAAVFNWSIRLLPSMQDAINGFSATEIAYGILPAIAAVVFILNYYMNEHSASSQEV